MTHITSIASCDAKKDDANDDDDKYDNDYDTYENGHDIYVAGAICAMIMRMMKIM